MPEELTTEVYGEYAGFVKTMRSTDKILTRAEDILQQVCKLLTGDETINISNLTANLSSFVTIFICTGGTPDCSKKTIDSLLTEFVNSCHSLSSYLNQMDELYPIPLNESCGAELKDMTMSAALALCSAARLLHKKSYTAVDLLTKVILTDETFNLGSHEALNT